ncbi:hypothetical protein AB0F03_34825 [Streptomyces sp. NPDC028722]
MVEAPAVPGLEGHAGPATRRLSFLASFRTGGRFPTARRTAN